jgi:hypothetical protein
MRTREAHKNPWDYIADHPKTSGAIALIALATTFSPRLNSGASWICIAGATVLSVGAIDGIPALRNARFRKTWRVVTAWSAIAIAGAFGLWLNNSKEVDSGSSQLRITQIVFHPVAAGEEPVVDIHYTNNGPGNIELKINSEVVIADTNKDFLDDGEEEKEITDNSIFDLEESLWKDFTSEGGWGSLHKASSFQTRPYADEWISVVGRKLSAAQVDSLSGNTQKLMIFALLKFSWNEVGSNKRYGYDICNFIAGNPQIVFDCKNHNGPTRVP